MEETIKRQRALTLVKRMETPGWFKIAVPVASIIGGFLFSAIFYPIFGDNDCPGHVCRAQPGFAT